MTESPFDARELVGLLADDEKSDDEPENVARVFRSGSTFDPEERP